MSACSQQSLHTYRWDYQILLDVHHRVDRARLELRELFDKQLQGNFQELLDGVTLPDLQWSSSNERIAANAPLQHIIRTVTDRRWPEPSQ
jgi:hypothetical protein